MRYYTDNPTPTRRPTRYIPAHIRRAVWLRDEGRCQWPIASGGVCGSTVRPQIHHKDAWAKHHGPPAVDKLMIVCDVHNDVAARQDYGDACMDFFTHRKRKRVDPGRELDQTRPR